MRPAIQHEIEQVLPALNAGSKHVLKNLCPVRVGQHYRAIGIDAMDGI